MTTLDGGLHVPQILSNLEQKPTFYSSPLLRPVRLHHIVTVLTILGLTETL
jgi:hypothetical protein